MDESSRDIGVYPFMASFPHLIDVGVMGTASTAKPVYVPRQESDAISWHLVEEEIPTSMNILKIF